MVVVQLPKYPCPFCHKNESTQLCDFVIDYAWTSAKNERGRMIGGYHITCDNQMCKDCAIRAPGGFEFCPSCDELRKHIKKNHVRKKGRLLADTVSERRE